ncbi:hypothetical protein F4774DRAFT_407045 [Daldinia eschscholtzii]|nr:hypothetical protein F4774DRAFT_407045 [Daldinia eschscholtzii]
MYSIISLNKGDKCPTVEFRAARGRYKRKSACKACRLGRTRCSGTLDGGPCTRCKRLGKSCQYENGKTRGGHCGNYSPEGDSKDTESIGATPPEQEDSDIYSPSTSSSSSPGVPSSDTTQSVTDDSLGIDFNDFDFNDLAQLQDIPSKPLFPSLLELVATSPQMDFPGPLFPFLPLCDEPRQKNEAYEIPAPDLAVLCDARLNRVTGHEQLVFPESLFDFRNGPPDAVGSSCQHKCLHTMTSSLSFLRSRACARRGSEHPEIGIGDDVPFPFNYTNVEDVLAVFERSMARLRIVENCPLACILSQDLFILLLLVVEMLANLLLGLAGSLLDVPGTPAPPLGSDQQGGHHQRHPHHQHNHHGGGSSIRLGRIGTFEITNHQDLQMIMKLLLQSRAQVLDAYICRWSGKIPQGEFGSLEADLGKIREDLRSAVFPESAPQALLQTYAIDTFINPIE